MQHTTPGCCATKSGAHTCVMYVTRPTEHISGACLLLCAHKQTVCHELRFFSPPARWPQIHGSGMQHAAMACCAPARGAHTCAMHDMRPTKHTSSACLLLVHTSRSCIMSCEFFAAGKAQPQIHGIGMQHTTPGYCSTKSGARTCTMHAMRPTKHISSACLLLCAHKQAVCHELRFLHHRKGGPKSTKLACSTPHRAAMHPKAVPTHVLCML